ncbi:uncharacterized protein Asalp_26030 [Aeromonas salmonicida subsp. pectinolytica 34mel]|uniref:Uncharacterized protein n=1 Tax=Aeromonas salmonicida subsp. pectinolytica 34mel TaxID=1324960 RepID=A0A2D1QHL6_AERSA|nr:uncharacterized protein Asalp_26030 [Aeromonas salmonicida subsp. pectinolytica 34mel]
MTLAAVRQSNDWHYVFPYTVVPPTKGHMRDGKNHSKRVMFWLSTALCRGALRRK